MTIIREINIEEIKAMKDKLFKGNLPTLMLLGNPDWAIRMGYKFYWAKDKQGKFISIKKGGKNGLKRAKTMLGMVNFSPSILAK